MTPEQWDFVQRKLAVLETQMTALVGNGQPGRLTYLENKVRNHERLIWVSVGAAALAGFGIREVMTGLIGAM